MTIEGDIAKKYGVSWAEAKDLVSSAQKRLGIKSHKHSSSETEIILAAVTAELQVIEEEKKEQKVKEQKAQAKVDAKVDALKGSGKVSLTVKESNHHGHGHHHEVGLSWDRKEMPKTLIDAGVPYEKWYHIYDMMSQQVIPAVTQARKMEEKVLHALDNYGTNQFVRSVVAPGFVEDGHEKKVLKTVHGANSASLAAMIATQNVSTVANYLLQPHDVVVTIKTEEKQPWAKDGKTYFRTVELITAVGLEFTVIHQMPVKVVNSGNNNNHPHAC